MNQKLDNYLVQKYPKIFIDRYENMTKTAMCWGFEHGDGWFWLLDQLCGSIQNYIDSNNKYRSEDKQISQVVATQVKEKFGTLNFYYSGGDEYIDGIVRLAEDMSANICEICGSTENVGSTKGWITTICKHCVETNERFANVQWSENKDNPPLEITSELRKIKLDKLNKTEI